MRRLGGRILDGAAVTLGWWLVTLGIAGVAAAARHLQGRTAARAKVVEAVKRASSSSSMAEHPAFQPYLRVARHPRNGPHP